MNEARAKATRDHLPLDIDGTVMKSKSFCGNAEPKIVRCVINASADMFSMPKVMVKYELFMDKEDERLVLLEREFELLFDYYPDEISFTPDEFIGLTAKEARTVKFEKDKAYLQS
mgnify:CR=1 FL=1